MTNTHNRLTFTSKDMENPVFPLIQKSQNFECNMHCYTLSKGSNCHLNFVSFPNEGNQ